MSFILSWTMLLIVNLFGFRLLSRRIGDSFFLYYLIFGMVYIFRPAAIFLGLDVPFPEKFFFSGVGDAQIYINILTILWSIFFIIGSLGRKGVLPPQLFPKIKSIYNPRLYVMLLFPVMAIYLGIIAYLISIYGSNVQELTRATRIDGALAGFSFIQHIPTTVSYLIMTLVFYMSHTKYKDRKNINLIIIPIAVAISVSSLIFGGRSSFIYFVVYSVLGYRIFISKISTVKIVSLGLVVVFLIVQLKEVRNSLWYSEYSWYQREQAQDDGVVRTISDAANLDSYDKFILLLERKPPTKYGAGFVDSVIAIVPRSVWPDKPDDLYMNYEFHNLFEPAVTGWPLKSVGEWYWNFAIYGMILGGLVSGLIFRSIQFRCRDFTTNPFSFLFLFIMSVEVFQVGYNAVAPIIYIYKIVPIYLFVMMVKALHSWGLRNRVARANM